MTAALQRDRQRSRAQNGGLRHLRAHERERLVAFLDDGLRRGERGRLQAEYPVSMSPRDLRGHFAWFVAGQPVAHAMLHEIEVCARGRSLRAGLIGNVYTAPEWRGQGLAQRCVGACIASAQARGLPIAMLWSEPRALYARLGFTPGGSERRIVLTGDAIARASAANSAPEVDAARESDFPVLERLYAAKPAHVARAPGALAKLARGPEVALRVARNGSEPIAYAACGRGDDLRGVIHEWAGDAEGELGCIAALHEHFGAQLLLASSEPEPAAERLIAAGAAATLTPLALVRVLDEPALARAIGTAELAAWPLYVWGFDSI